MKGKFFGNQSITGLGEDGAQSETYYLEPSIIFEGLTWVLNSRLQQSISPQYHFVFIISPQKTPFLSRKMLEKVDLTV